MASADIGLIGLAVMGQNLALNMDDHGFRVAVFNRTTSKVDEFLAGAAAGSQIVGTHSLDELVGALAIPRKVMLMVRAGEVVDRFIEALVPLLSPGDVIVDGGNSHFPDSTRRTRDLAEQGILFVGAGVSGGEEGARHGPSIMPGGNPAAWPLVQGIFQAICAQVDGVPCCQWVGPDGAGHYVKMVHNGIEYGDMQLIAEAYALMRYGLNLSVDKIQTVFARWNTGVLDSYLIEITSQILAMRDTDGGPLIDKILDKAAQKGTGKWTVINALDLGIPLTLIGEAVFARCLSSMKDERVRASRLLVEERLNITADPDAFVQHIHDALYAAKICSYAQGYMLMREAARDYGWQLDLGNVALLWRGGCIIRSRFLNDIKAAYDRDPGLENLLQDDFFRGELTAALRGWRETATMSVGLGIPAPAMVSALAFYDGYRCERLPADLIQAQRDFFGAHMYERVDAPAGQRFHTDWTGSGGPVASTSYEV
jgi:6-phosphogluconate dehydrogenase